MIRLAEVQRTLRFMSVKTGKEVDRLELLDDGTIRAQVAGGAAAGVLATFTRIEGDETAAFAALAGGWANMALFINHDDLDSPPE